MYDIIFLSYDEPNIETSWNHLKERCPWALRVHGIKGIYNAHLAAAKKAKTKMFWVVDADTSILPSFSFDYKPKNPNVVHVWYAYNPVNELKYGFGGIKLFPRKRLLSTKKAGIDVTCSVFNELIVVPDVASMTMFNTTPFNTWRAAFRENAKLYANLTNGNEADNTYRMEGWLTSVPNADYGEFCIDGAWRGQNFAAMNADQPEILELINDYDWLKASFEEQHGSIQNN